MKICASQTIKTNSLN